MHASIALQLFLTKISTAVFRFNDSPATMTGFAAPLRFRNICFAKEA